MAMTGLDELFDYKNQIAKDILTDKEIVKLINSDICEDESAQLMYTQVFPFEYIPKTVDEGKTFVCVDVDIQKSEGKTFLYPTLYIWVFTHQSNMRLPKGGVRVDKLCSEICRKINGSRKYGLGELEFSSTRRYYPISDFRGKVMTFYSKDYNRLHDISNIVPSNRKRDK